MKIIQATLKNLNILIPLFEEYRKFYKQLPNTKEATLFLSERLRKNDAVIFIAFNEGNDAIGFTQLYPTFSSISMQLSYILNDLYVASEMRGKGIGEALLNHAKEYVLNIDSKGLTLETAIDNPAQKLYEKLGWEKDNDVLHYTWINNQTKKQCE